MWLFSIVCDPGHVSNTAEPHETNKYWQNQTLQVHSEILESIPEILWRYGKLQDKIQVNFNEIINYS